MKSKKKTKLAIFDIDGTIFRSSLLIALIDGLVEEKIFPKTAKKEMEKDYLAWLNRKGSYDSYIKQVVNIHNKHISGCKSAEVNKVVRDVIAWQRDRVYKYTRDMIKELRKKDYFLLAISGSPDYTVSRFAKYLGFDLSYGSVFEVKNSVFTGNALNRDVVYDKSKVVKRFLFETKLNVDLKNSIAVGDTEGDIPVLEMVGNPIAFNPNNTLARHAKKKHWKIVVERKDVIYEIKSYAFLNNS